MAVYTESSPWFTTPKSKTQLGIWEPRPIPALSDDYYYSIQPQYTYRPDLLAYDLYGNPRLWWVFAQRNADIIFDPIYDFRAGVIIQLPKKSQLLSALGLSAS
jgi:Base plate wedge protein 53